MLSLIISYILCFMDSSNHDTSFDANTDITEVFLDFVGDHNIDFLG